MATVKLNIPFSLECRDSQEHPGVPFAYVDHDLLSISGHLTETKAKQQFKPRIVEAIEQGLRAIKHTEHRTFQTVQGDVFIVRWDVLSDCWGYDICGAGRKYTTSCPVHKAVTFDDALAYAKQHAIDNFGGIAWE